MWDTRENIDCIVRGEMEEGKVEVEGVECHKLVLCAVSPSQSNVLANSYLLLLDQVLLQYQQFLIANILIPGLGHTFNIHIIAFISMLCLQFLITNIHLDNFITIAQLGAG